MPNIVTGGFLDATLNAVTACTTLTCCAGFPEDYEDIATRALGSTALTEDDFTLSDGVVSGRRVTVASKSGILVEEGGVWDHIAIDDGTDYVVTTIQSVAVAANGVSTMTTPAFDYEIADAMPTSA